ncbi:MAG TPA: hypothetical protein GXX58_06340 [Gelria sp.]|nr:hypothetical protein [Gelria sp.]
MNVNTRLSRLESVIPVEREPKADLSELTTDELKFLVAYVEQSGKGYMEGVRE